MQPVRFNYYCTPHPTPASYIETLIHTSELVTCNEILWENFDCLQVIHLSAEIGAQEIILEQF